VQWDDLGAAVALVLVFEGLMPFVSPASARRTAQAILGLDDRALRAIGFASIGFGLLMLWWVRG
jgi:uncharacterized protein YjeT (DUF2065 family)